MIESLFTADLCILILTLLALCISESCIKIKLNLNFHFHTSLRCLRALTKPFEAPHRSVKIKIWVLFSVHQGFRREGLTSDFNAFCLDKFYFSTVKSIFKCYETHIFVRYLNLNMFSLSRAFLIIFK